MSAAEKSMYGSICLYKSVIARLGIAYMSINSMHEYPDARYGRIDAWLNSVLESYTMNSINAIRLMIWKAEAELVGRRFCSINSSMSRRMA